MKIELARAIAQLPDEDLREVQLLADGLVGGISDDAVIAGVPRSAWLGFRAVHLTGRESMPLEMPLGKRELDATALLECMEYWAEQGHFLVWGGSEAKPQLGTIRYWANMHGVDYGGRSGFRIASAWPECTGLVSGKKVNLSPRNQSPPVKDDLPTSARRFFWLATREKEAGQQAAENGWTVVADSDEPTRWLR